jgi:hypothetical protein
MSYPSYLLATVPYCLKIVPDGLLTGLSSEKLAAIEHHSFLPMALQTKSGLGLLF